ncbi:MAG: 50S ribosomal protein L18 [Dehalococcoidia bacterium]
MPRKRNTRVRRVVGTANRPRLCVFRSLRYIYGQVIDDTTGHTLASACSFDLNGDVANSPKTEEAKRVGDLLGKRALEKGVQQVAFDRRKYKYHGRIKALADAAREAGLKF